uniref:aralkylamine N-acetyltransferase n=1 Tax=Timema monikensis TaxID=170555 RepID=A0A7R9EDG3_9NEOP|nr:unnamed protein product [Timema monikensis]
MEDRDIRIMSTGRAPYETYGSRGEYLVTTYAWDGNSCPGMRNHLSDSAPAGQAMSSEDYHITPLSPKDRDRVVEFLRRTFFRDEPLNIDVQLLGEDGKDRCAELENYSVECINEGKCLNHPLRWARGLRRYSSSANDGEIEVQVSVGLAVHFVYPVREKSHFERLHQGFLNFLDQKSPRTRKNPCWNPHCISQSSWMYVEYMLEPSLHLAEQLDVCLSLAAFSSSGKLVAVCLNGSNEPGHIPEMEAKVVNCTSPKFQKILNLLTRVEKEVDVFTRFPDVHKALEVRILAVEKAWGGRGIGTKLLDMSRQIAIENGFPMFRVDCTSHYSARAVAKLGLSCIYTLQYKDHKNQDGFPVFNPAHPHNEVKTYVERIQA